MGIVEALEGVKLTVMDDRYSAPASAICGSVYVLLGEFDFIKWVQTRGLAFSAWSMYSGDPAYPVPGTQGKSPGEAFDTAENFWTGEYGELRKDLLSHLIEWYSEREKTNQPAP